MRNHAYYDVGWVLYYHPVVQPSTASEIGVLLTQKQITNFHVLEFPLLVHLNRLPAHRDLADMEIIGNPLALKSRGIENLSLTIPDLGFEHGSGEETICPERPGQRHLRHAYDRRCHEK